jgi:site-specific DNA-adenine methylase
LTDFKAKLNKSKINKYTINNNNKTNTKHEFNVKYERYKQDISKDRKLCLKNVHIAPNLTKSFSIHIIDKMDVQITK